MAFWLYTSGTTGTPKAAMHAHRTLLAWHGYGRGVLAAGPGDRVLATSKLFFAYALGNALLIPLACPREHVSLPATGPTRRRRPARSTRTGPPCSSRCPPSTRACCAPISRRRCSRRSGSPCRRASGCSRRSTMPGAAASASRSSTGSARPRRCSWCSPTGPDRAGRARRASPSPGSRRALVDGGGESARGRRRGRALGQGAVGGDGVLGTSGAVGARVRRGVVSHGRRVRAGRRRLLRAPRPRGRLLQGRRAVGVPGRVESALLEHPAVAEAGRGRGRGPGGLVKPFAFVVPARGGRRTARPRGGAPRPARARLKPHERPRDV